VPTFAPDTLFHIDDPDTSKLAAISLDGTATERVMHSVIAILAERGPLAPYEVERIYFDLRGRRDWPVVAFYSIHRRMSQMKKQVGVLVGTGERSKPPTGKAAERLQITTTPTAAHAAITAYFKPKDTE